MQVKYPLTNPVRPGDFGYQAAVDPPPDGKPAPTPSEGKLPPIPEPDTTPPDETPTPIPEDGIFNDSEDE